MACEKKHRNIQQGGNHTTLDRAVVTETFLQHGTQSDDLLGFMSDIPIQERLLDYSNENKSGKTYLTLHVACCI